MHGLYNKQGKGKLKINIAEKDDFIMIDIEDDGIGRAEASRIRMENFPTHKSMGIKLTEERLKLINQNHNVRIETVDLMDAAGPCGTRVTIGVPQS